MFIAFNVFINIERQIFRFKTNNRKPIFGQKTNVNNWNLNPKNNMTLALTAKACLFMKNEAGLLTCNSWYHLPA